MLSKTYERSINFFGDSSYLRFCGFRVNITNTLEVIDLEKYFEKLRTYIAENPPDFGDGASVLTLLYEAYAESNRMDDGTIKEDFNELYRLMNGMELQEMDKIIYPVCTLCRDHQRSGFVEGVKVGIRLKTELAEE